MGAIINFLIENYIYFVFVAVLLILALIGYIVDNKRTDKVRKELSIGEEEKPLDIPEMENVKLAETINQNNQVNLDNMVDADVSIPPVAPKQN